PCMGWYAFNKLRIGRQTSCRPELLIQGDPTCRTVADAHLDKTTRAFAVLANFLCQGHGAFRIAERCRFREAFRIDAHLPCKRLPFRIAVANLPASGFNREGTTGNLVWFVGGPQICEGTRVQHARGFWSWFWRRGGRKGCEGSAVYKRDLPNRWDCDFCRNGNFRDGRQADCGLLS